MFDPSFEHYTGWAVLSVAGSHTHLPPQRNSILFFGMIAGAQTKLRTQATLSGSKVGDRRLDQIQAIAPSAASRTRKKWSACVSRGANETFQKEVLRR